MIGTYLFVANEPDRASRAAARIRPVIAVRSFEEIGVYEDLRFSVSLAEAIVVRLVRRGDVAILAARPTRDRIAPATAQEVGEALAADYLLHGTIRWTGSPRGTVQLRIMPRLVRVSDAALVWADVSEWAAGSSFQLVSAIADSMALSLGAEPLPWVHGDRRRDRRP